MPRCRRLSDTVMSTKALASSLGAVRTKQCPVSAASSNFSAVAGSNHAASSSTGRRKGKCVACCRTIALTSVGLLYKHGPSPGCPGSNQQPAAHPQLPAAQPMVQVHVSSDSQPSSSPTMASVLTPTPSSLDILNLLNLDAVEQSRESRRVYAYLLLISFLH